MADEMATPSRRPVLQLGATVELADCVLEFQV